MSHRVFPNHGFLRALMGPGALVVFAAACGQPAAPPAADAGRSAAVPAPLTWPVTIAAEAVPTEGGTAQPQLTASSRGVVLSWIEQRGGTATLRFSERADAGWSPAQAVASGDDWFVSWADVPSVQRLADGRLAAQWLKAVDLAAEAYDIRIATSRDDGRTWTRAFAPHADGTRTQHGFVSLFEWPAGANGRRDLGLVWLDGRDQVLKADAPEGGAMALRTARFDLTTPAGAGRPTSEGVVDDRVCECCPTSVAITDDGVLAAFRDRSATEVRDIHTTRFENGAWTTPVPVHADNWQIDACPVNGPAISARGRRAAVAWFTVKEDVGQAYVAFSDDAGRTWGQAVRVDDGTSRGHVDVELLDDGSAAVSWIEFADARSQLRVRRVDGAGGRSAPITVAGAPGSGQVSGIPRMARAAGTLVFAWAESGSGGESDAQVKAATARVQ